LTLRLQLLHFLKTLEHHRPANRFACLFWEFVVFGVKQAWACLFGGLLLALILVTHFLWPVMMRCLSAHC
jgi:uncharacterized membrane protein YoaT (DUF817 family)